MQPFIHPALERGRPVPLRPLVGVAIAMVMLAGMVLPAGANAVIGAASVLDGPANDILGVDGVALAPDGSGGILYTKQLAGQTHLFARQFVNGRWGGIAQVDVENPFSASQPAIAAGSGGRLLVVWVQPRNVSSHNVTEYALMGASLEPGATSFAQAIIIDPNVGEPVTGDISAIAPRLAMAPNGVAYVVYRVIEDDCISGEENPECPPGSSTDKVVSVRVARFHYLTWSSLGSINRAPQLPMRNPTPANAPAIGIDLAGNGLVAWQEPGSDGVARIWVRRLFGVVPGNVLQASPESIGSDSVSSDAEAPTVAMSVYGAAQIAYRIQGAPGSAVRVTQMFLNSIGSELGLKAAQLNGAKAVPGGAEEGLGAPSAGIDLRDDFRVAWSQAGAVQLLGGSDAGPGSPATLGTSTGPVFTSVNPAGGGTTAWSSTAGGLPVVAVREDYAHGAFQSAQLAGDVAGPVGDLALAGSSQGDALLGFTQGPVGHAEVVGALIQAPPAPFTVNAPSSWVRASGAPITWEASPDALAGVTYTVYVDGRPRLKRLSVLATALKTAGLGDGEHRVQVLASDASGQQTMTPAHILKLDTNPPTVKLALIDRGRGVKVNVRDRYSGVDAHATRVSFGDGSSARGHATASHRYASPGTFWIAATVRDKAGNHATVRLRVRVT